MPTPPAFLITIDTEGDNAWSKPAEITTENARHLPRFQQLCERYGLYPTWLTNHEMATSEVFREFGRDVLARGAGEIGMHLHAWTTPPLVPLTANDLYHQPYLAEYSEPVLREKVRVMTETLEETFEVKMLSHRAGRWLLDTPYARALAETGYTVDCSVTPGVSWEEHLGDPAGKGGADYRGFPGLPYWMDLERLDRPGSSPLLQIPMTITDPNPAWAVSLRNQLAAGTLPRRIAQKLFPGPLWLRPNGENRGQMIKLVERAVAAGEPILEFMIHSSEFMPGGSPYFPTPAAVEGLFDDLEALFQTAGRLCAGMTLAAFAAQWPRPSAARNSFS